MVSVRVRFKNDNTYVIDGVVTVSESNDGLFLMLGKENGNAFAVAKSEIVYYSVTETKDK